MDIKMGRTIVYDKGRLMCVGQGLKKIPSVLARLHGSNTNCLDLSDNALISLEGMEDFPELEELIVDCNSLTENSRLPFAPNLITISANKNKIEDLELFLRKVASSAPNIRYLSLLGNPACPDQLSNSSQDEEDYTRYRFYVVHHLPGLMFLDSAAVQPAERTEAKLRGHLLRVAKPLLLADGDHGSPTLANDLTPLPRSRRGIGDHQGAYGKCRYRYSGKHSEGNRFIQNNDL